MYSSTFGFLVAVLAMMANPEIVDGSATQRAGNRRSVGARSLPYLESRVLKLRLRRRAAVTAVVRSVVHRQPPRLHDVDGYWRTSHRRGDPACDHAWLAVGPNRQTCSLCDGLRWWVTAYERGDVSRGNVEGDRRVTLEQRAQRGRGCGGNGRSALSKEGAKSSYTVYRIMEAG